MFERNETIKSETHDNKKGFRIIIKNLDNEGSFSHSRE